ncbi:hypothetical protein ACIOWI_11465 [Streptomyces sp. NPDC087659]|uniref:hypothetical protein n=1 Tax=unclassified Streptomyces TaxID=2593676 RepID=UPI0036EE7917
MSGFETDRLGGRPGAVVHGVDLGGRRPEAVFDPTRAALPEHEVLAFRDQRLHDEAQPAFAGRLGPLTPGGRFFGDPGVGDEPERAMRTAVEQAAAAGIACGGALHGRGAGRAQPLSEGSTCAAVSGGITRLRQVAAGYPAAA